MARAVTKHATSLYENIGFKRDIWGGTEREYQPRPEWLKEYWIHERTHNSDRGGDGTLWSKYDRGKPHVLVHKEMGNATEEDEIQGVDDPAFYEVEEDDAVEEVEPAALGNTLTEEQRERAKRSREAAMRKRAEKK